MADLPVYKGFDVGLVVQTKEDSERVHFKAERGMSDGGWSRVHMMKMVIGQCYEVVITVRPAKTIKYMCINGTALKLQPMPTPFLDNDVTVCSVQWEALGMEVTKRSKRYELPVEIEFADGDYLKQTIRTKFYAKREKCRMPKCELRNLWLKCHVRRGETTVGVVQEDWL